jgi:hypothetical protein
MALRAEHELHRRRFSRNIGLGLTLAAFVALVFALTLVKIARGEDEAMRQAEQASDQQAPANTGVSAAARAP